jgi:hypothetical protein
VKNQELARKLGEPNPRVSHDNKLPDSSPPEKKYKNSFTAYDI